MNCQFQFLPFALLFLVTVIAVFTLTLPPTAFLVTLKTRGGNTLKSAETSPLQWLYSVAARVLGLRRLNENLFCKYAFSPSRCPVLSSERRDLFFIFFPSYFWRKTCASLPAVPSSPHVDVFRALRLRFISTLPYSTQ